MMRVRRRLSPKSGRQENVTASWRSLPIAKSKPPPHVRFDETLRVRHEGTPWRPRANTSPRSSRPCLRPRDPAQWQLMVRQNRRPGRSSRRRDFPSRKIRDCRHPPPPRTPKQPAPSSSIDDPGILPYPFTVMISTFPTLDTPAKRRIRPRIVWSRCLARPSPSARTDCACPSSPQYAGNGSTRRNSLCVSRLPIRQPSHNLGGARPYRRQIASRQVLRIK